MPYLGNEPAVAYTSTTKDTFSGDASTTDFTMSKSANVNAVRVVVENVVQNPTVAYTCSGTTISFTSAPPTGTNNIYVVHLGPPAATVAPPTTINNATTFTGGVTLKNETAEDTDGGRESIVTFQGTQSGNEITTLAQIQASHDGTSDDQAGDLIFKTNDGSDGASPTEVMRLDSGGTVNISSPSNARALKMQNGANNSASQITFLSDDGTEDSFVRNQSSSSAVDTLSFGTGGSERMRLTSDGDLCLGRTSVLFDFGDGRTALAIQGSGSQDYCSLQLGNNGTASNGQIHGLVAFYDGTNENSRIQSIRYSGTDDSHLQFYTSSGGTLSEAARILDDGALIVGDSADIRANSQVGVSIESEGRIFMSRGTGNGGFTHLAFYNGNGLVGSVTTTNAATAFSTSSDYRLKENITDISDGITRVKQLAPKRFNWIADETNTAIDGFLAHEAQTVVPEAITGTKDETEAIGNVKDSDGNNIKTGVTKPDTLEEGHTWTETGTQPVMQGIDQSKLVPLLTAALQEAIAKIETLETKVAALEG